MNLADKYILSNFEEDIHVISVNELFLRDSTGKIFCKVPEQTKGKVVKLDRKNVTLSIYFETDVYLDDISPSDVIPLDELDFDEAYDILKEFFGHHTNSESQYQFNIKMYRRMATIPSSILAQVGTDKIWQACDRVLEDILHQFVGLDYDYAPLHYFPWIKDYWTAGRSGGYLILEDNYRIKEAYDDADYHYEEARTEYEDDLEHLAYCKRDFDDAKFDLIQRVYDLRMIQKLIKRYQDYYYESIQDPDFWKEYFDMQKEVMEL